MMKRIERMGTLVLVLLSAAAGAPANAPAQTQTLLPPELALATFDTAWHIVHRTHFDTTFNGVDWVALRDELRPRVADGADEAELRQTISSMLERLGQSHFALIPRELADTLDTPDAEGDVGDAGLDVRLVGDAVLVTRVDADGAAWRAGVRPGWKLVTVDDDPVEEIVASAREAAVGPLRPDIVVHSRVLSRLQGPPGSSRSLVLLDGLDARRQLALQLLPTESTPVKLGNFPTFFARFESQRVAEAVPRVGVIWFNYWMVPLVRQIDAAVDEYRDFDGIVIDLRGNGGGVAAMVAGIAGHFLDERIALGVMRTRTTELRLVANPRRVSPAGRRVTPYDGPLAILTDGQTGSASEVFAGGMQAIGRARVFGTTSAGAVLPATLDRLPNGDVLYHAFAEFTAADGITLEGRGVIPDEEVPLRREDLLAGRDAALQAAIRWIEAERQRDDAR